jgi:Flp pilus assembly protein TadD
LERSEEALAAFDCALALDPTNALAWSNKAITLRRIGRNAEAEAAERRAKELGG